MDGAAPMKSAVTGIGYDSVGMICITSRIEDRRHAISAGEVERQPDDQGDQAAASIRLSVAMLASHRPSAPARRSPP